jgi:uncharacterized damage-inducible protein DinB
MSEYYTDEQILNSFRVSKQRVNDLLEDIDEEQFNAKPDSKTWSIGECIDHMNKTGALYLRQIRQKVRIEKALDRGINRKSSEIKPRFISSILIKSMEPPVKFKLRSPKSFKPRSELNKEETRLKFRELQDQFIEQFKYLEENNLLHKRMTSPATNLLKMELGEVFLFIAAHQRRHLWQAENLAKS